MSWRIRNLIKDKGFTQKQFAERVGLSQGFISELSSNKKSPNLDTLELICNALDISLSDFFKPFDKSSPALSPYLESLLLKCKTLSKEHIQLLNNIASKFSDYITISDNTEAAFLPLLGSAAAGVPLNSQAFPGESIMVPMAFSDSNAYYAITAKGDSMSPKILDGDFVVVKHQSIPSINDLVLVRSEAVDDVGYAIKILKATNRNVTLNSINPNYPPMILPAKSIFSLEKIVHIIHRSVV